MIPAPAPAGPWAQPGTGATEPSNGNPWIVALTIGLAVVVVGLVAVGLRAAAGRSRSDQVTEVPARRDIVPPSSASPSTSSPQASPSTTATTAPGSTVTTAPGSPGTTVPGSPGTTATTVPGGTPPDLVTPRLKVTELDGRFEITVPRSWVNEPTVQPDQAQWVPHAPTPAGQLGPTEFLFAVRWGPSQGCTLERCAAEVVDRMKSTYPGILPTTTSDKVGGLPAIRIDATFSANRLAAWIVVKGDRFWVPQLRGPVEDFDALQAVLQAVVATMSFG